MAPRFETGRWSDELDLIDFLRLNSTESELPAHRQFVQEIRNASRPPSNHHLASMALAYSHSSNDPLSAFLGDESGILVENGISNRLYQYLCSSLGIKSRHEITEELREKSASDHSFIGYTTDIRRARKAGVVLPADSRGRHVSMLAGAYPVYGCKRIITMKRQALRAMERLPQTESWLRRREEIQSEIDSVDRFSNFTSIYGIDSNVEAEDFRTAVRCSYLAVLFGLIDGNGIPFSLGNITAVWDAYLSHDLSKRIITEDEAATVIAKFISQVGHIRILGLDRPCVDVVVGWVGAGDQIMTKTCYLWMQAISTIKTGISTTILTRSDDVQTIDMALRASRIGNKVVIVNGSSYSDAGYCTSNLPLSAPGVTGGHVDAGKLAAVYVNGGVVDDKTKLFNSGNLDYVYSWVAGIINESMNCRNYFWDKYAYESFSWATTAERQTYVLIEIEKSDEAARVLDKKLDEFLVESVSGINDAIQRLPFYNGMKPLVSVNVQNNGDISKLATLIPFDSEAFAGISVTGMENAQEIRRFLEFGGHRVILW